MDTKRSTSLFRRDVYLRTIEHPVSVFRRELICLEPPDALPHGHPEDAFEEIGPSLKGV